MTVTRPCRLYTALVSAQEYGAWGTLLFGSDVPFFTPQQTADALHAVVTRCAGTHWPVLSL